MQKNLVDISTVKINHDLPKEQRIADYVRQIKNPHNYICEKTEVILQFATTGETLEDRLKSYLLAL